MKERTIDWSKVSGPLIAEPGLRPGVNGEGDVHRFSRVVHDRLGQRSLYERARLVAVIIDEAGIRCPQIGGAGRIAGPELQDAGGQFIRAERAPGLLLDGSDGAQLELRPGLGRDGDRNEVAVAVGIGRAGGSAFRDAPDLERNARDRHDDARIVVAGTPEGVDQGREIGLDTLDERLAVGRRILAELVERRGFLQGGLDAIVAPDLELDLIGQCGGRGFRLVGAEQAEEVERPCGADRRARAARGYHKAEDELSSSHPTHKTHSASGHPASVRSRAGGPSFSSPGADLSGDALECYGAKL
jgi:hypothetical protein